MILNTTCSYMFDIIYITWFVHITTAVISGKFWYTYIVVSYWLKMRCLFIYDVDPLAPRYRHMQHSSSGLTLHHTSRAALMNNLPSLRAHKSQSDKQRWRREPRKDKMLNTNDNKCKLYCFCCFKCKKRKLCTMTATSEFVVSKVEVE